MLTHIRLSKDKRTEENLHLATIGSKPGTKENENRTQWNEYLSEVGFPQVEEVGTRLPDHLRCRDSDAARILMSMSNAAAIPTVEETVNGTTEENDKELPSRCIPLWDGASLSACHGVRKCRRLHYISYNLDGKGILAIGRLILLRQLQRSSCRECIYHPQQTLGIDGIQTVCALYGPIGSASSPAFCQITEARAQATGVHYVKNDHVVRKTLVKNIKRYVLLLRHFFEEYRSGLASHENSALYRGFRWDTSLRSTARDSPIMWTALSIEPPTPCSPTDWNCRS